MSKHRTLLILIAILAFIVGCQQSSGSDDVPSSTSGGSSGTTSGAPTVSSVSPADGSTDVSISSSITVTFSKAMDSSTITTSTITVGSVSGTVSYSNKVATFTPSSSLANASTYTITVSTGVKDTDGNAMASAFTSSFTTVSGDLSVIDVAAGSEHTCALLGNGTVKCWGDNQYGQLGIGSTTAVGSSSSGMGDNLAAVDLGTDRTALQIAVGADHTCARLDDSSVKCWGLNNYGQLGQDSTDNIGDDSNEMGDNLSAIDLGTNRTAVEITAGAYHTCARLDNGKVKCWGQNTYGQLGYGNTDTSGDASGEMSSLDTVDISSDSLDVAIEVKAGWYHTCVRTDTAEVKCWGRNNQGQLGIGSNSNIGDGSGEMGSNLTAVDLGSKKAVELAMGFAHTCARLDDGSVQCWGYNDQGQLGIESTETMGDDESTFTDVSLGTDRTAIAITAGEKHTCVILDNGLVKCWGSNSEGQLGQEHDNAAIGASANEMGDNLGYSDLGTNRTAQQLSAGASHSCVRMDNGRIKCWGRNVYGQLGQGNLNPIGSDTDSMGDNLASIELGTGDFSVVNLAVGYSHSCANLGYSSVKCWGKNDSGQLGQGNTSNIGDDSGEMGNNLSAIDLDGNAVEIAVGKNHSCALLDDGSVKCWGDNQYGQLGQGNTTNLGDISGEMGASLPSVSLGTDRKAVEIAAGGDHTCARLDDSSVKCWGYNAFGQLGQGNTNNLGDDSNEMGDSLSTISLGSGRTATQITAGENFSCARLDNGTVKCWGNNSNGQLGQGDTDHRGDDSNEMGNNLAAIDLGSRTVIQITAGYTHVCALLDDSSVKCWGNNGESDGKLGLESTEENVGDESGEMGSSLATIDLGSNRTALQIAAGSFHTCAILDDGSVKCWGKNDYGQLGLGDKVSRGANSGDMGDDLSTVSLGLSAVELSAGYEHTCARLTDGQVKCWGLNQYGQLGLGDTSSRGDDSGEMGDSLSYVDLGSQ